MAIPGFHPFVEHWFTAALGTPTETQLAGWAAIRRGCHTLIAAPTGSGKTLAAFLVALDDLTNEALAGGLPDEVRVVYVSPLKALSADIHKNLSEPRKGIRRLAEQAGLSVPRITAAVRTGDTSSAERAAMLRRPPHILVTTPESLYLLLTSDRSRQMLQTVRTVIIDEIHAVIGTRRGAHLALSVERLQQVAERPLLRLGLSATQKPVAAVARFLTGADGPCEIIDQGHRRKSDLGVELPRSALDAVMASDVWEEYYDRLAALIESHRTTLIFVNTRRLAERIARHLTDRLGDRAVTAHHGSLSKDKRLDAEMRLKNGELRALVATASLELGIDIGHVDLVCQIGSPHRISTALQRIGRSGHTISGTPKGRIFPVSRDDLVECAALLRAVHRGQLDAIVAHDAPLDVLAQQIVAESACAACAEDDLFRLFRRADPYRALERTAFDRVVTLLAEGFSTRRGRRGALVHRDEVNGMLRARRGARLLARTSGGAIPEIADYRVVLDPENTVIGTLNEDFAIESSVGDIFQLGNASWRVLQVSAGTVRVADAKGAPPTIPFWLGEAPARSDELSHAVSDLRAELDVRLAEPTAAVGAAEPPRALLEWLADETGISAGAAEQIVEYFAEGRAALGVIPTQHTLVLERFFDESGGMQLVLHAPFGSRINRAWCLALRKRFCRQFNFELQAAATEDALLLSLGPQHSFPLADVFRYLHPETTRDVLVQALLDAPVFPTRWRWNTTISLAVPRNIGGRRIPPQLQRMLADDLMAAAFPDAAACLENIPGDRAIPDHPLVQQTIRDCLHEAMDFDGLRNVLARIHAGHLRLVARDTPEPSCFAHDILNAKPYAFVDDAPLEERRVHAVQTRRMGEPSSAHDLGTLDPAAIARVRDEARPNPRDADELHDALVVAGFLMGPELEPVDSAFVDALLSSRRACRVDMPPAPAPAASHSIWIAAERLPELLAVHPHACLEPKIQPPASRVTRAWSRDEAIAELLRGRLTIAGPVTVSDLADSLSVAESEIDSTLLALESDGVVLRGRFDPHARHTDSDHSGVSSRAVEWCDRALLARIHRYTLNRLRAEIEPVSPADFMRFLFAWQHVEPSSMLTAIDGLREVLTQLDGYELPAAAWERYVLPVRIAEFEPQMLDMLCLAGEVSWGRFSTAAAEAAFVPRLVPATPIAIFLREHRNVWCCSSPASSQLSPREAMLADPARQVLDVLRERGASFLSDLTATCKRSTDEMTRALGSLVAAGLAVSDGFSGLRALIWAARAGMLRGRKISVGGRWSAVPSRATDQPQDDAIDIQAWCLLRRYGVVFRRLLTREANAATWRELTRVYRRLEARGEIRGGRFVSGMSGEQFALPQAVERLREVRRMPLDRRLIAISTADPLNLAGIVTAGDRVRVAARNRIVYRDGVPLAVREGDVVRELSSLDEADRSAAEIALRRRLRSPRTVPLVSS